MLALFRQDRRKIRAPLGLLGAVALIVPIEREIARRESIYFTTVWASDWREAGRDARRDAARARILCFGDSLAKFGVCPTTLESSLGEPAFNLALNAGHPGASLLLLRRALASGARPDVILVDFAPHLLASPPRDAARQWPELADAADLFRLATDTRDASFGVDLAVRSLVPSARTRDEIRDFLKAEADGNLPDNAYAVPRIRKNRRDNKGAQLMERSGKPHAAPELLRSVAPRDWTPDPVALGHAREFLRLATESGARVFLIVPPMTPEVRREVIAAGLESAHDRFLRGLLADYPGLRVIDGRDFVAGDELHCDAVHLSDEGARAFSRALASVVSTRPAESDRLTRLAPPASGETIAAEPGSPRR